MTQHPRPPLFDPSLTPGERFHEMAKVDAMNKMAAGLGPPPLPLSREEQMASITRGFGDNPRNLPDGYAERVADLARLTRFRKNPPVNETAVWAIAAQHGYGLCNCNPSAFFAPPARVVSIVTPEFGTQLRHILIGKPVVSIVGPGV